MVLLLFGCHGKWEICKVPAGKKDSFKYQQGKNSLLLTSRERRHCCTQAGKEDHVDVKLVSCLALCRHTEHVA